MRYTPQWSWQFDSFSLPVSKIEITFINYHGWQNMAKKVSKSATLILICITNWQTAGVFLSRKGKGSQQNLCSKYLDL